VCVCVCTMCWRSLGYGMGTHGGREGVEWREGPEWAL